MRNLLIYLMILLSSSTFAQSKNSVILSDKKSLGFSDETIIKDKLPENIVILVSQKGFSGESILFMDSTKLIIKFQRDCGSDKNCIELQETDIQDGRITLRFLNNKLIGIGDRLFSTYQEIVLPKNGLTVKISNTKAVALLNRKPDEISESPSIKTPTLCDSINKYGSQEAISEDVKRTVGFLCEDIVQRKNGEDKEKCCRVIPSPLDYVYQTPCLDKNGNAVSFRYQLIIDKNNPYQSALVEIKKAKGKQKDYPSFQTNPMLRANQYMVVSFIGEKGKSYTIDTSGKNSFLELEPAFSSAFQDMATGLQKAKQTKDSGSNVNLTEKAKVKLFKDGSGTRDSIYNANSNDSLVTIVDNSAIVRNEIFSLHSDIDELNSNYPYVSFLTEGTYKRQLNCLFNNMVTRFNLEHKPTDGNDLMKMLLSYIKAQKVAPKYYGEICKYLGGLAGAFDEAVNKSKNYQAYQKLISIPNSDELKIEIKDGKDPLFSQTFNVKGGFKIDLSTGIFVTGLSISDYVAGTETFRYKDSRDSITPTGQNILVYNGTANQVTRTVLHKNQKLNFSTGLLAHGYKRSGGSVDWGGVSGFTIDINGQVQFMAGGSLMFKFGNSRISLVGGAVAGKEKVLSNEYNRYYYDGKPILYNRLSEIPADYTLSTSPATYLVTKLSWFAGITFNFTNLKK